LAALQAPLLICQGERDPFGNREEVTAYGLPKLVQLHWLEDGNHDLAPRNKSTATLEGNRTLAVAAALAFMNREK